MISQLNHSARSAFKPCSSKTSDNIQCSKIENPMFALQSNISFKQYQKAPHIEAQLMESQNMEAQQQFEEVQNIFVSEKQNENDDISSADSTDNVEHVSSNGHISISNKLDLPKKRKNKEQTKHQILEKHKDEGRGGNCIASNITKTLIRVLQCRLQNSVYKKFKALIEQYKIKSQKENTIIVLLILYDLVKTGQMSFSVLENIFSLFIKSLHESKENCEKKISGESERRGFHLKNRKMYVNFIKINTQLYFGLTQALKEENSVQLDLKSISDIISDTYDRKQRQIQKALSKIKSIILNHASLKALFGYEQNDIKGTLFESIEYAYRRNLAKRCNQTKTKVQKFFNKVQKIQPINSDQEKLFICFSALKLVGEKEEQIWEEFVKNTNLKRQYNQTKQEGQKLKIFLTKEIPDIFSRFDKERFGGFSSVTEAKMEEDTDTEPGMNQVYGAYVDLKNDMEF